MNRDYDRVTAEVPRSVFHTENLNRSGTNGLKMLCWIRREIPGNTGC